MHDPISDLKGLQPEVKTKLESEGIRNTTQFLERTWTPQQRAALAHKVGTTPVAIKELANPHACSDDRVDHRSQDTGRNLTSVITSFRVDGGIILFNGKKDLLPRTALVV